jgi:hypothetical protein
MNDAIQMQLLLSETRRLTKEATDAALFFLVCFGY